MKNLNTKFNIGFNRGFRFQGKKFFWQGIYSLSLNE